ncbi:MAG: hypothetical protein WB791_00025 [Waddliaceae bacterium]
MEKIKFNFSVGSDFDYEDLIADIGYDNQLVALLTQEEGFENMKIKIYPPRDGDCWNFRLDEFEEIIHKARKRLWELRKIDEEKEN